MTYRSKRTRVAATSVSNVVASDSAAPTTSRSPEMKPMGLNNSQAGQTLQPPTIPHSSTATTLPQHKPSASASFSPTMIPQSRTATTCTISQQKLLASAAMIAQSRRAVSTPPQKDPLACDMLPPPKRPMGSKTSEAAKKTHPLIILQSKTTSKVPKINPMGHNVVKSCKRPQSHISSQSSRPTVIDSVLQNRAQGTNASELPSNPSLIRPSSASQNPSKWGPFGPPTSAALPKPSTEVSGDSGIWKTPPIFLPHKNLQSESSQQLHCPVAKDVNKASVRAERQLPKHDSENNPVGTPVVNHSKEHDDVQTESLSREKKDKNIERDQNKHVEQKRSIHNISNKTNSAKSRLPNSDSGWPTNVKFDAKEEVLITVLDAVRDGKASTQLIDAAKSAMHLITTEDQDYGEGKEAKDPLLY
ncbi:hypothetical protein BVRB_001990 [Beta vulgaris subsp. vulgaris]|uniref:Uncharacterized protein n=1 Tax=Beta vulgaris subsp. vulgaris TaxID=3555 RepID=A0A0J8B8G0_BETVV|nr:hypothetical protein BVRB_001990 [Beta vulgaris subsp. vulgaris]